MSRLQTYKTREKPQALSVALSLWVLGWLSLLIAIPAQSLQAGRSATAPIKVSRQEAEDNLQVKTLKPEYPYQARAKGLEGIVRLRIVIDERGNVTDIRALSGDPL